MSKYPFKKRTKAPKPQEKEYPPSETVQDDAMEIKEIFSRYNTALPEKAYPYFDTEDLNDIGKLHTQNVDLTDLEDLQKKTKKLAETIQEKYDAQMAKRAKQTDKQMGNNADDNNSGSGDGASND